MLAKENPSKKLYERVSPADWNDWRWQIENSIHTLSQLAGVLHIPVSHLEKYGSVVETYRFSVTPYYLSLIDVFEDSDPLRLQCFPDLRETDYSRGTVDDPLEEEKNMAVPDLIHRYPDRCLTMVTGACAMYCRHCNRKRRWKKRKKEQSQKSLRRMIDYIAETGQIREVILSGGDPLMMNIETLDWFLASLKAIPHVEVIRIGSRVPVVLPMRIDQDICNLLRRYRPLWFITQFNHPKEITEETAQACEMLMASGIPVVNQSVLLRGVNDSYEVMRDLLYGLQRISVKPYYLFQCEPVRGVDHFQVDVRKGLEIMEKLWRSVSGLCIPRYVYDLPGGRGKIPLQSFPVLS
jgi:lysine 2,3-aminomutase